MRRFWHGIALGLALVAGAAQAAPIRRFALLLGSNNGGAERVLLRYANQDARRLADVLLELGGVLRSDRFLLENATLARFRQTIATIQSEAARARGKGERPELVFYYSGHSDEEGILLEGERLPWEQLRNLVSEVDSDVRLVILDSCSSGQLTRVKGGVRRPAFTVDQSMQTKGMAVLTSSSATEASQESDSLRGAFFTHFLIAGLRGAADASNEGRVTLSEAYQYAFHETLSRTQKTHAGPQHPSYDFRLVGSGDVVLTDLRMAEAALDLGNGPAGSYHIFDAQDRVVAEVVKHDGVPLVLGLSAGDYRIYLVKGGRTLESRLTLRKGEQVSTATLKWTASEREITQIRGDDKSGELPRTYEKYTFTILDLGFNQPFHTRELNEWSFNLLTGRHYDLDGASLSVGGEFRMGRVEGAQLSGVFNWIGEDLRGVQASTFVNHVRGNVTGVQASTLYNATEGHLTGLQLGGAFNGVHGHTEGAQFGSVNLSRSLRGVQFGALNIAGSVDGVQFGLVNVARSVKGASIGFLNFVGDGFGELQTWHDSMGHTHVSTMLGARNSYSQLEFAVRRGSGEVLTGISLGARFLLTEWMQASTEFGTAPLPLGKEDLEFDMVRARGFLSADVYGGIAVFAGGSWHGRLKRGVSMAYDPQGEEEKEDSRPSGETVRLSDHVYQGRKSLWAFFGGLGYRFHGK